MIGSAVFHSNHWDNMVPVNNWRDLKSKEIKLLVLHGGADISPSIYGMPMGYTHASERPSARDEIEMELVKACQEEGIPILGICRGAQLLCAMSGGKLWQDVEAHGRPHPIIFRGEEFMTNSCHHQMMIPTEEDRVLAVAPNQSPFKYKDGSFEPVEDRNPEPEIVYFPKLRGLGVQGHPEWLSHKHDLNVITKQLVGELFDVEITCGR